jgi:O-antigen/teichoic acid export membrane protein
MALRTEARIFRLVERALALAGLLRRVVRDTWSLAKLEAESARTSLVSVAILGFAAALLAVTAWSLLVFGLVTWIADRWLDLPLTLLLVALVMIGGVVSIAMAIKRQVQNLKFTATRRQLEALRHGD